VSGWMRTKIEVEAVFLTGSVAATGARAAELLRQTRRAAIGLVVAGGGADEVWTLSPASQRRSSWTQIDRHQPERSRRTERYGRTD
jgi:hypothetical protein